MESKKDRETCVDVSAARIQDWINCCQNMRRYLRPGEHPLLDIAQSRDGTKIKIYLNESPGS